MNYMLTKVKWHNGDMTTRIQVYYIKTENGKHIFSESKDKGMCFSSMEDAKNYASTHNFRHGVSIIQVN